MIIFGLDNTAFMCAADDGSMLPLKKVPEIGGGFHAIGELVVEPDRSLSHTTTHLKWLIRSSL